jgi:chorismate dehydratase
MNVGGVSYLNAKPLLYGLESVPGLHLKLEVPSRLIDGLRRRDFDVALLPVIDYQKMDDLKIVPSGGIGCDGPTLTVRIFSSTPIDQIDTLACDPDSHTSVALAQIILSELYHRRPRLIDITEAPGKTPRLLIGDKVVCQEPAGFAHHLDLGAAWKELTGMPFVFAVWTARSGIDLGNLPQQLEHAKETGRKHLTDIITQHAIPRGWPSALAMQYLSENLKFDIGPDQLKAIAHFHQLAAKLGIIALPAKRLEIY